VGAGDASPPLPWPSPGVEASHGESVPAPPGDSAALAEALRELRRVEGAGGWGEVAPGPALRPGEEDPRIPTLRERLRRSGDLPVRRVEAAPGSALFDAPLEEGVRRFQARHGLEVDGVVGAATMAELNVPVEDRIRQVALNLDRRRELGRLEGPLDVVVNVPGFVAWVHQRDGSTREHRVITGRVDRPTPLLVGRIGHVVLAPYWNVPPNILSRDKLPLLRRDPAYLERQHMTVLARGTGARVDPASIRWDTVNAGAFNRDYWLRQEPGSWNALGEVKFIFPNPHHVYMHDTPDRHLFQRPARAFSSGCIRVEGAMELALLLLAGSPEWTPERIRQVARGGSERWIALRESVPVRTVYWTAWVDRSGELQLRRDLYGLDAGRTPRGAEEALSECRLPADPPVGAFSTTTTPS